MSSLRIVVKCGKNNLSNVFHICLILEEFAKMCLEIFALNLISTPYYTDFVVPEALNTLILSHGLSRYIFGLLILWSSGVFTNAILIVGQLAISLGFVKRWKASEPRESRHIFISPSN